MYFLQRLLYHNQSIGVVEPHAPSSCNPSEEYLRLVILPHSSHDLERNVYAIQF